MEYVPALSEAVINDSKSRGTPLSSLLCNKVPALLNRPRTVSPDVTVLIVTVPGFAKENVKKSKSLLPPG